MISRKSVFALVMAVSVAVCSVNAFAAGGWQIGATAGALKGSGDFGDASKTGFGGGLFADYMINDQFAVGPDFAFNSVKAKNDGEPAPAPGTGTISSKLTITNFGGHAKWMLPMADSPLKPYFVAGAGMYSSKAKFEATGLPSGDSSESNVGGRGGVGASYMVNSAWGIGAEGNYHFVNSDPSSTKFITGVAMVTYHVPTSK